MEAAMMEKKAFLSWLEKNFEAWVHGYPSSKESWLWSLQDFTKLEIGRIVRAEQEAAKQEIPV